MKRLIASLFLILGAANGQAQGTTRTVFPYGLESQNGIGTDTSFLERSDRQQWYRNDYLAQTWTSPVLVSEVAFRVIGRTETAPDYNATIPHVEIWMSTSSRAAAQLGPWESNAGPDAQMVYGADSVQLTSPGGAGPNPFGLRFTFDQPFVYDPANGHLLMRIITAGADVFQGADFVDAHSISGLATTPIASWGYPPMTFSNPAPRGLVVEFTWLSVPEPSSSSILISALIMFFVKRGVKSQHSTFD